MLDLGRFSNGGTLPWWPNKPCKTTKRRSWNKIVSSNPAKLNVGGTYFLTSVATLTREPNTFFAAMFSGRWEVKVDPHDKAVFVDHSPLVFEFIIDYLRTGEIDLDDLSPKQFNALHKEADFYQIASLLELFRRPTFFPTVKGSIQLSQVRSHATKMGETKGNTYAISLLAFSPSLREMKVKVIKGECVKIGVAPKSILKEEYSNCGWHVHSSDGHLYSQNGDKDKPFIFFVPSLPSSLFPKAHIETMSGSPPVKRSLPLPQRKTPVATAPTATTTAKPAVQSAAMAEMSKRAAATRGIEGVPGKDGIAPVVVPRRNAGKDSPAVIALEAKKAEIQAKIASGSVAAPSTVTAVTKLASAATDAKPVVVPRKPVTAKPATAAPAQEKGGLSPAQKEQVSQAQAQISQVLKEISESSGKEIHVHIHAPIHIHLDSKL